jgi:transposase
MIRALDLEHVRAMMTIGPSTDAEVFETSVKQVLARKLRHGDIVVLDSLGAWKGPYAGRLIEVAGAPLLFLPPYSPDLNPIERCFSELRSILKDFGARTQQALERATRTTMDLVGFDDGVAQFTHCGEGSDRRYGSPGGVEPLPETKIGQKYFAERALRAWACLM